MSKKIMVIVLTLSLLFGLFNGISFKALASGTDTSVIYDLDTYLTQMDLQPAIPVKEASGIKIDGDLSDWTGIGKIPLPYNSSQNYVTSYGGAGDLSG